MTLYTRKKGEYVALNREQVRRLRRTNDVVSLQNDAQKLARSTRALSTWLMAIQRKALRLDAQDLVVTRLPNIDRLLSLADAVDMAVKVLKGHK